MGPAVDEFERRLLGRKAEPADVIELDPDDYEVVSEVTTVTEVVETLLHDDNPVMTWNAGNAVIVFDPANNRKVDKSKATGRIDGIVAAVMAVGISSDISEASGTSIYDEGVGI